MSIMRCERHGHWDSDVLDECPICLHQEVEMGDKTRGLYNKFNVTRSDGSSDIGGKHEANAGPINRPSQSIVGLVL